MLRLGTFNLYQFCPPTKFWYERSARNTYTEANWNQKKAWISQQLALMNCDIVGFQEIFSVGELRQLCNSAGYGYCLTVEEPRVSDEDQDVFVAPVVAIASRYPIISAEPVQIDATVLGDLPVGPDFRFSRAPIRAVIDVPNSGHVIVYVAHLKSKRPIATIPAEQPGDSWSDRVRENMRAISRGHAASLLQRGAEAACLYHRMTGDMRISEMAPIVVLGDLNDDPNSIPLRAATMQDRIFEIDEKGSSDWPNDTQREIYRNRFTDAYAIKPDATSPDRPATHYHRGRPGVLDYILVSNGLIEESPSNLGRVIAHDVYNDHIQGDGVGDRLQSDHGQVAISVKFDNMPTPYRFPGYGNAGPFNSPPGDALPQAVAAMTQGTVAATSVPSASPSNWTREDFVAAAGGVFKSFQSYDSWRGSDKHENFWRFYFDEDFGWVKSAYGSIPISTLHQKQKHSIEHIIPKSFLRSYLRTAQTDVRRGATVNPLNFIAAERGLNSARSSFPFDMEDDKVSRPFRIPLNPEAYRTTGLDAENEWVIPSRSRGDIARAIIYMVLVYQIDELYNGHIDTLRHWAKVDAPTPPEIAFNEWTKGRLGISNPLITSDLAVARKILDNDALMNTMQLQPPSG